MNETAWRGLIRSVRMAGNVVDMAAFDASFRLSISRLASTLDSLQAHSSTSQGALKMNAQIEFVFPRSGSRATVAQRIVANARQVERQEWLLDEALAETFPASDPISPSFVS
jgi:hypothetical protein